MRQTHAARAEAAAQRREEKRRQEKDRMLQVVLLSFLHTLPFRVAFQNLNC